MPSCRGPQHEPEGADHYCPHGVIRCEHETWEERCDLCDAARADEEERAADAKREWEVVP